MCIHMRCEMWRLHTCKNMQHMYVCNTCYIHVCSVSPIEGWILVETTTLFYFWIHPEINSLRNANITSITWDVHPIFKKFPPCFQSYGKPWLESLTLDLRNCLKSISQNFEVMWVCTLKFFAPEKRTALRIFTILLCLVYIYVHTCTYTCTHICIYVHIHICVLCMCDAVHTMRRVQCAVRT